jgi:hypothetical protein
MSHVLVELIDGIPLGFIPSIPKGLDQSARCWRDGGRAQAPTPGNRSTNDINPERVESFARERRCNPVGVEFVLGQPTQGSACRATLG